jgi:hypothetical protein
MGGTTKIFFLVVKSPVKVKYFSWSTPVELTWWLPLSLEGGTPVGTYLVAPVEFDGRHPLNFLVVKYFGGCALAEFDWSLPLKLTGGSR